MTWTIGTHRGEHVGWSPAQLRSKRQPTTTVLARVNARVLDTNRPLTPDTIPVSIVDRRHSRGVIVLTFGRGSYEATSICIRDGKVRLERLETFRGQARFHLRVDIPSRAWNRLLQKAGVLPTDIYRFEMGPEPTPMPPAPPAPPLYRLFPACY